MQRKVKESLEAYKIRRQKALDEQKAKLAGVLIHDSEKLGPRIGEFK